MLVRIGEHYFNPDHITQVRQWVDSSGTNRADVHFVDLTYMPLDKNSDEGRALLSWLQFKAVNWTEKGRETTEWHSHRIPGLT